MRAWLWHHLACLREAAMRLARQPLASLLGTAVLGIVAALPAGFYVALGAVQRYAGALAPEPRISVFLALEPARARAAEIEQRLRAHPQVRELRYVPREQALEELSRAAGIADLVEALPENPLPDAFVVTAREAAPEALERLREEVARWPGVAHVQLDAAWARRLAAALEFARFVAVLLAALFASALIAVTFNTIRLQVLTRREEIEVAKLIGATDAFIRRPFLYYGALQGLAAGAAAWALVWGGVALANGALAELSRLYAIRLELAPLAARESVALLAAAAALGWLGARLSVSRYLASIEPR